MDEELKRQLNKIQSELVDIRSSLVGYKESGGLIKEVNDAKVQISGLKKLVYTINGLVFAALTFITSNKFF